MGMTFLLAERVFLENIGVGQNTPKLLSSRAYEPFHLPQHQEAAGAQARRQVP
jgi:hypothetical protein